MCFFCCFSNKTTDLFSNYDSVYFYPLLRSNRVNLHPIMAGIYSNIFYHHSCGSRGFSHRGFHEGYYKHYEDKLGANPRKLTQMLFENPNQFINNLVY